MSSDRTPTREARSGTAPDIQSATRLRIAKAELSLSARKRGATRYAPRATTKAIEPEKVPPLILEIGERFTRIGFSKEVFPRECIRTSIHFKQRRNVLSGMSRRRTGTNMSEDDWLTALTPSIHAMYFKILLAMPKDRRVLIVENPFWPIAMKHALARILYSLGVTNLQFVPLMMMPLYASGASSGTVVDVGFGETRVQVCNEGLIEPKSLLASAVGMQDCIDFMRTELLKANSDGSTHSPSDASDEKVPATGPGSDSDQHATAPLATLLTTEVLEDIICRSCFVLNRLTPVYDEKGGLSEDSHSSSIPDRKMRLKGGRQITIPGPVRARAADAMFGYNPNGNSIAEAVLDSILKCQRDVRARAVQGIILSGGASMIPGFEARFYTELDAAFDMAIARELSALRAHVRPLQSQFPRYLQHWIGASLLGTVTLGAGSTFFVSKEDYEKDSSIIHDWTRHVPDFHPKPEFLEPTPIATETLPSTGTFDSIAEEQEEEEDGDDETTF
jgi:actin-related protein 10